MELGREVFDISEDDFWSHLHVPEGTPGAEALARAVRHGLAGRKRSAYAALGAFHRAARGESWQMARERAGPGSGPAARGCFRRRVRAVFSACRWRLSARRPALGQGAAHRAGRRP